MSSYLYNHNLINTLKDATNLKKLTKVQKIKKVNDL